MKPRLDVYKIGGALINDAAVQNQFLASFCETDGAKILVHGGGRKATEISKALQIETKMIEGRRITDADTLEVVTMVYAGLINKKMVSALRAKGCKSIGLCGADMGLITSHKRKHPTIDYGYVGDIDHVDAAVLNTLLTASAVPVICAITDNAKGQLLNTNADTMAATIASAMCADFEVHLHFVFEFDGVMKDIKDTNSLIKTMSTNDFETLKKEGIITDGMVPKIQNAVDAKINGVHEVRICGINHLHDQVGTSITS